MTGEEAMKETGEEIDTDNVTKENFPRKSPRRYKSKTGSREVPVLFFLTTTKAYSGSNLAMT